MENPQNQDTVAKILNKDKNSKQIKDYIANLKKDDTYGSTTELHACSYVFSKPYLLHTYSKSEDKDKNVSHNIGTSFLSESDNATYANVEHVILYMYDPKSKNNHFEGVIMEDKKQKINRAYFKNVITIQGQK